MAEHPGKHVPDYESSGESMQISSPSDLPMAALAAWNDLPEKIKKDPYLAPFRRGYEKHIAKTTHRSLPLLPEAVATKSIIVPGPTMLIVPSTSSKVQCKEEDTEETEDIKCDAPATRWIRWLKLCCLVAIWATFTMILMIKSEKVLNTYQISVPPREAKSYLILEEPKQNHLGVSLTGAFLPKYYRNLSTKALTARVQLVSYRHKEKLLRNVTSFKKTHVSSVQNVSDEWKVPLVSSRELIELVPEVTVEKVLQIDVGKYHSVLRLQLRTNLDASVPVAIGYDLTPIDTHGGIILAALVLLGLYILIVFEVVHRTLAAILASTMSVAILAYFDERPSMAELVSWLNVETLLLLFSMMVLVAIFAETGVFDYLAVFAFKVTNGKVWPLVNVLCIFTATLSSFLDNVTTMMLMTPVTIRLCEVMQINPVPILMALIMYSNVGAALTPVGDPPNVIIASNSDIQNAGVNFGSFILHMGVGLVFVMSSLYILLRFIFFRNIEDLRYNEPQEVQDLRHEIGVWQRAAASLTSYSKDEDIVRRALLKKVKHLTRDLTERINNEGEDKPDYSTELDRLQNMYPIRDKELLWKSGITLLLVISMFFLHSVPALKLSLGWTALLGAMLLLLLADNEDIEGVLARVEWGTLIFFAALFVLMEALSRLGLIEWVGQQTENVILSVSESARLAVAIELILWVSAAMSSLVDNIPLSTMMVRVITSLAKKEELNLPLRPLVWAMAFGACLGGNGTLIGSSSNVVCAGVAEQHGYRFTFMQFFKIGMPVTIVTVIISNVYLIICHVALEWH
ncbi:P protein [Schistocerca serialis cubense]|uniref:P protein n=1 Tax=Schistocerca serialis cubense TaxID=2023355 RepID=UPI00214E578E|nr:P protein [Schistocerca serialis cubense]